jgi:hypothetical protein
MMRRGPKWGASKAHMLSTVAAVATDWMRFSPAPSISPSIRVRVADTRIWTRIPCAHHRHRHCHHQHHHPATVTLHVRETHQQLSCDRSMPRPAGTNPKPLNRPRVHPLTGDPLEQGHPEPQPHPELTPTAPRCAVPTTFRWAPCNFSSFGPAGTLRPPPSLQCAQRTDPVTSLTSCRTGAVKTPATSC